MWSADGAYCCDYESLKSFKCRLGLGSRFGVVERGRSVAVKVCVEII